MVNFWNWIRVGNWQYIQTQQKKISVQSNSYGGSLQKAGSTPRRPFRSQALVYTKNYLFILGIGPTFHKELTFFGYVPFFVLVFVFCYNAIYLQCLLCFVADTEILSVLLVYILFCLKNHAVMVTTIKSQLFLLSTNHRRTWLITGISQL